MLIRQKVLAAMALVLGSGFAHAGGINWSVGISLPPVATVISNAPRHVDSPYYAQVPHYAPPPVYHPAPVYYVPPAVIYRPAPRYVEPVTYVVERRWSPHRHWQQRERDWDRSGHRGHGRHRDRD